MADKKLQLRLLTLATLLVSSFLVWSGEFIANQSAQLVEEEHLLKVFFLDVGQGDAIFIETTDGKQMLVDGGPDSGVLQELSKVMPFFDKSIDVVVGTHPDKDHIGGLVDVLERYDVEVILRTNNENDTSVSQTYSELVASEGAEVLLARRGQTIALGASTTVEVLYPESDSSRQESNASSIVLRVVYGDTSFLLTGDLPKNIEEYLVLVEGENLESDVLKVGHHGSRTSTSELFLAEVSPEFAVISAGADNRYGHPHLEVTDMLFNQGVETLSTAEVGTVRFYSNGIDIWIE